MILTCKALQYYLWERKSTKGF